MSVISINQSRAPPSLNRIKAGKATLQAVLFLQKRFLRVLGGVMRYAGAVNDGRRPFRDVLPFRKLSIGNLGIYIIGKT